MFECGVWTIERVKIGYHTITPDTAWAAPHSRDIINHCYLAWLSRIHHIALSGHLVRVCTSDGSGMHKPWPFHYEYKTACCSIYLFLLSQLCSWQMRLSIHKGSGADDVLHLSISVYTSLIWACAVCRTWPGRVSTKQSHNPIWAHCPRHIVRTRTIKMSPVQKRQHGELECRKAKSFSEVGCVWWRS